MKSIFIFSLFLMTSTASAQIIETDASIPKAMQLLIKGHEESSGVRDLIESIEAEYGVTCSGKSSCLFPDLTHRVTYKANCIGKPDLHVKIVSKFKSTPAGYEYRVKYYTMDFLE